MTVSRVIWCDRGWQPHSYGFCPDEAAWNREMKRFRLVGLEYPDVAGGCTPIRNKVNGALVSIVTISNEKRPAIQVVGLLVHEAMHVWRHIRKAIGERKPSMEFEAYAMQCISQNLIAAYEHTRGKLCR